MIGAILVASAVLAGAPAAASSPAPPLPMTSEPPGIEALTRAAPAPASAAAVAATPPRLPRFAPRLAVMPTINGPSGWRVMSDEAAWAALATATPTMRQAARWAFARSLIGAGRGAEARGVLEVMLADESDLALVGSFRLALAAARIEAGDAASATALLDDGTGSKDVLGGNAEACAWRLMALATLDQPAAALQQIRCAMPALRARPPARRAAFYYAGARAALAAGNPAPVEAWLAGLPDDDPGANLYRGRAALALGDPANARIRLGQVTSGRREHQMDAAVALLEADLASAQPTPAQLAKIDNLAFVWRGDAIEARLLALNFRLGTRRNDLRRSLAAGAALVRYGKLGASTAPILAEVQALIAATVAPGSALPISEAAGIYWDYRDLAPIGARGDLLASQFAERLQAQGLHGRAANLLRHQLLQRTEDIARGPLSVRVATLYILAGEPTKALAAIRDTDATPYPAAMQWDRHRVEAVALYLLGRRNEAVAVLQDVPDAATYRAEIAWKSRDWATLSLETAPMLPAAGRLDTADQAVVLRHAVALAMLGREAPLAQLHRRYAAGFVGVPSESVFNLLTGDVSKLDAETLATAMRAMPSASPAGTTGDLFDVPPAAERPAAGARRVT